VEIGREIKSRTSKTIREDINDEVNFRQVQRHVQVYGFMQASSTPFYLK